MIGYGWIVMFLWYLVIAGLEKESVSFHIGAFGLPSHWENTVVVGGLTVGVATGLVLIPLTMSVIVVSVFIAPIWNVIGAIHFYGQDYLIQRGSLADSKLRGTKLMTAFIRTADFNIVWFTIGMLLSQFIVFAVPSKTFLAPHVFRIEMILGLTAIGAVLFNPLLGIVGSLLYIKARQATGSSLSQVAKQAMAHAYGISDFGDPNKSSGIHSPFRIPTSSKV